MPYPLGRIGQTVVINDGDKGDRNAFNLFDRDLETHGLNFAGAGLIAEVFGDA
jgi:hypothetical protein